jgi:hypothetical protein
VIAKPGAGAGARFERDRKLSVTIGEQYVDDGGKYNYPPREDEPTP